MWHPRPPKPLLGERLKRADNVFTSPRRPGVTLAPFGGHPRSLLGQPVAPLAVTHGAERSRASEKTTTTTPDAATRARIERNYGNLPLSFEANRGQTDPRVKFFSRGPGYSFFLTPDEAVMQLRSEKRGARSEERGAKMAATLDPRPSILNPRSCG